MRFITAISYTSMNFVTLVDGDNNSYGITVLVFLMITLTGIFIAAEAHLKV